MIRFAVFAAIVLTCMGFAVTQDTQRKIKQELGEYCKGHVTYRTGVPVSEESAFARINKEIIAQIDRKLPLVSMVN